jgi:formylmethanofuran dehydrogenase subunit E
MFKTRRVSLDEGTRFHGHLGPYLVLGILAGELALKKLKCKKYFGLEVKVWGANKKPKSCLIDGLQLSCGATYGKGNIKKANAEKIAILFRNTENSKKMRLTLKDGLSIILNALKSHKHSEAFAKRLYKTGPLKLFELNS